MVFASQANHHSSPAHVAAQRVGGRLDHRRDGPLDRLAVEVAGAVGQRSPVLRGERDERQVEPGRVLLGVPAQSEQPGQGQGHPLGRVGEHAE